MTKKKRLDVTPKVKKAKLFVPTSRCHRVFYRSTQVECSIGCFLHDSDVKEGMKVALLDTREEFTMPTLREEKFYVGFIEKLNLESDQVTIRFDGHPFALSLTASWKYTRPFVLLLSKAEGKIVTKKH